jgi:hypothetical protein
MSAKFMYAVVLGEPPVVGVWVIVRVLPPDEYPVPVISPTVV